MYLFLECKLPYICICKGYGFKKKFWYPKHIVGELRTVILFSVALATGRDYTSLEQYLLRINSF